MEMAQIEASSVLLFVFPNDTWGAAEMVMVSILTPELSIDSIRENDVRFT